MRRGDDRTALLHSFLAAGKRFEKNLLPREWLTESVELPFEDGLFPVTAHYDALLTQLYGNWHTLPSPSERRCKEHAAILDLEHSYERYIDAQAAMKITEFTRSIR